MIVNLTGITVFTIYCFDHLFIVIIIIDQHIFLYMLTNPEPTGPGFKHLNHANYSTTAPLTVVIIVILNVLPPLPPTTPPGAYL